MYLGSFPLLYANTVKTLNEVVQQLCLFACFIGEAVAAYPADHTPCTCRVTTKHEDTDTEAHQTSAEITT